MSGPSDVHARSLPGFREWIEDKGGRAPGFEDFAAHTERMLALSHHDLTPTQKSFARLYVGLSIAVVELCHIENRQHGRSSDEIAANVTRVFASAEMYAIASICREGSPWRSIAKMITEEFRAAAKVAADGLTDADDRRVSAEDGVR